LGWFAGQMRVRSVRGGSGKNCSNSCMCGSGRSPAGRPVVPGPPFEICAPHFTFGPLVAAYIQYNIFKMWPPLLVFGPSFWFLAPFAAIFWRRACRAGLNFEGRVRTQNFNPRRTLIRVALLSRTTNPYVL